MRNMIIIFQLSKQFEFYENSFSFIKTALKRSVKLFIINLLCVSVANLSVAGFASSRLNFFAFIHIYCVHPCLSVVGSVVKIFLT